MTEHILEAQLCLFKAQLQNAKASPEKASAIEDLVSQVGRLLKDKSEDCGERQTLDRFNAVGDEQVNALRLDKLLSRRWLKLEALGTKQWQDCQQFPTILRYAAL